jgi:hypothetical protein
MGNSFSSNIRPAVDLESLGKCLDVALGESASETAGEVPRPAVFRRVKAKTPLYPPSGSSAHIKPACRRSQLWSPSPWGNPHRAQSRLPPSDKPMDITLESAAVSGMF